MRRGTIFWGTVLVILGVLMLLGNLGLLGGINIWEMLWPVFLILLGVWVLIGTFNRRTSQVEHANVPLEGASRGKLRIQHGAGRLSVYGIDSVTDLAVGDFGGGVEVSTRKEGETMTATLAIPTQNFPFNWIPGEGLEWSVGLNQGVPLALELQTGANDAAIDLSRSHVTDIRLESGASNTTIRLPEAAGETRVVVEAGAAKVSVQVPQGVAGRIRTEGGVMGVDVDTTRFPRSGNYYQSQDYDAAANRADINIKMGAGSVKVS